MPVWASCCMLRKARRNVGLIGLGIIGSRVAASLRGAGFHVSVWNRTATAAPNFLASPAEVAAAADTLQIFVADGAAVLEVIEAMGDRLTSDHVVICSATIGREATLEAAARVQAKGAAFLDAPFTGSKVAAGERKLVYYVAGEDAAYLRAKPVLEASSRAHVRLARIGDAAVVKVVTNMIAAVSVQALAEAVALVRQADIEPTAFAEALELNACRSGTMDLKLPKMLSGDYEPHFSLKHMFKDVQLGIQMANGLKIEAPSAAVAAGVLYGGIKRGWGDLDFSAIFRTYEAGPASKGRADNAPTSTPDPAAPPPALAASDDVQAFQALRSATVAAGIAEPEAPAPLASAPTEAAPPASPAPAAPKILEAAAAATDGASPASGEIPSRPHNKTVRISTPLQVSPRTAAAAPAAPSAEPAKRPTPAAPQSTDAAE